MDAWSLIWTLLLYSILFVSISCESMAVSNDTDCRDRHKVEEEEVCSSYSFVGTCNETNGLCNCNVYTVFNNNVSSNVTDNTTENVTTGQNSTMENIEECFYLDSSTNLCQLRNCWRFSNSNGECEREGKKRLTALLLSIFLINFGAGNFYIERYELAVPQIILGLLLCCFQCGSCAVAWKTDDESKPLCIFCCSVNSFLSLLFATWWLADLIIFSLNTREDGDGCPLLT